MGKTIVIIIIIFLLLGGAGIYLYFKYERNIEVIDLVDLSIFAIEEDTGLMNKTSYIVRVDNFLYGEGNTSKDGAVLHKVPFNKSINVINRNIDNQSYYIDTKIFTTAANKTYRVILDLVTFGGININQEGMFGENKPIVLTINSTRNIKNMYFCVDYSTHIIFVEVQNFTRKRERCYIMNDLEADVNLNITMKYTYFGQIDESDYLKIDFFDVTDKIVQTYEIYG